MPKYIEATYLENLLKDEDRYGYLSVSDIYNAPTADVVPVVYGRWIDKCVRDWHCSICDCEIQKVRHYDGYAYKDLPNFCPNCGARMDGGSNNGEK